MNPPAAVVTVMLPSPPAAAARVPFHLRHAPGHAGKSWKRTTYYWPSKVKWY